MLTRIFLSILAMIFGLASVASAETYDHKSNQLGPIGCEAIGCANLVVTNGQELLDEFGNHLCRGDDDICQENVCDTNFRFPVHGSPTCDWDVHINGMISFIKGQYFDGHETGGCIGRAFNPLTAVCYEPPPGYNETILSDVLAVLWTDLCNLPTFPQGCNTAGRIYAGRAGQPFDSITIKYDTMSVLGFPSSTQTFGAKLYPDGSYCDIFEHTSSVPDPEYNWTDSTGHEFGTDTVRLYTHSNSPPPSGRVDCFTPHKKDRLFGQLFLVAQSDTIIRSGTKLNFKGIVYNPRLFGGGTSSGSMAITIPKGLTIKTSTLNATKGTVDYSSSTRTITWMGFASRADFAEVNFQASVGSSFDPNQRVCTGGKAFWTEDSVQKQDDVQAECFVFLQAPAIAMTKHVKDVNGGLAVAGDELEYTVAIKNNGLGAQPDNPQNEWEDELPLKPTNYVEGSATASIGTIEKLVDRRGKLVGLKWNGAIAPGATLEIRYKLKLKADVAANKKVCNSAVAFFDAELKGKNNKKAKAKVCFRVGEVLPASEIVLGPLLRQREHILLYNLSGKLIALVTSQQVLSELSLANGVYLAVITTRREDGTIIKSEVKKLIILR